MCLAQAGDIQLFDENGHNLVDHGPWLPQDDGRVYVRTSEQQIIADAILKKDPEIRAKQSEEDRLRRQRLEEEEERRKQEQGEQRKARLKQTDPTCPYKTLKAAYADGWVDLGSENYDGDSLILKGHILVHNVEKALSKPKLKENLYVYKATLRTVYGLTPRIIEELDPPDEYCVNPHYQSGPPANLYLIERVEAWIDEHKDEVEDARASRAKRSASAKAVHDKKRVERYRTAEEWVNGLAITVSSPLPRTLLEDAHKCFALGRDKNCLKDKGLHAYCRHRLTNYESLLRKLYENDFSGDLYPLLRKRVDAVVMAALLEWTQGIDG